MNKVISGKEFDSHFLKLKAAIRLDIWPDSIVLWAGSKAFQLEGADSSFTMKLRKGIRIKELAEFLECPIEEAVSFAEEFCVEGLANWTNLKDWTQGLSLRPINIE